MLIFSIEVNDPTSFLKILHLLILEWGKKYYEKVLVAKGYDLFSKNDLDFINLVYKMYNRVFEFSPKLTVYQFLKVGFLDKKMEFCVNVAEKVYKGVKEINSKKKNRNKRVIGRYFWA